MAHGEHHAMTTPLPNPFVEPEKPRFFLDEPRFMRDITQFLPENDPTRLLLSKEMEPVRRCIERK